MRQPKKELQDLLGSFLQFFFIGSFMCSFLVIQILKTIVGNTNLGAIELKRMNFGFLDDIIRVVILIETESANSTV